MIADVQHLSVCSLATCRTLFRMCWLVRFTHLMLDSQYSCGELKGFECVLHKPSGRFVDQGYFLFLCALYVCFLDSFFTYSVFVILFVCFWNWVLGRSGCLELFMQPKVTLISWEAPTSQVLQLQGWTTRESLTVSSEKFLIWTMFRLSIYKKNLRIKRLHPKEICIGIIFYKQYAWVWLILLLNNICICTWYILTILIFYHHHLPYYPSLPLIFPTNLFPMSISIHFLFCDLVMGS